MCRLDKEFSDREASVPKVAEDAKRLIEQGMGKLNRLSSKALKILSSAESKHLSRKVALQQREHAVLAREQALATREEQLAGRLGALDAREQQLKDEVAQRLADDHRKELEAKELAYQKIRQELEETQKSPRLVLEQAEAAERLDDQERQGVEESAQTLAAFEGKLKDVVEEKEKLSQDNVSMSKEMDDINRHI